MSMDIYYTAKRKNPLSEEEREKIEEIGNKYWEQYPRKEEYEGPGTFDTSDQEDDIIYFGNLRIPFEFMSDDPEDRESRKAMEEFMDYWLKFITDITRLIPDAEWDAQFEDIPFIWEEENGWRFLTNEEFMEMGYDMDD